MNEQRLNPIKGESRDRWVTYEIACEPPYERGERRTLHFLSPVDAAEAAELAASEVDSQQMIREQWDEEDIGAFHDGRHYIEVETHSGPRRFAVRCRVKREYSATEILP